MIYNYLYKCIKCTNHYFIKTCNNSLCLECNTKPGRIWWRE